MSERWKRISRLLTNQESRAAYIKAKLSVLVPAQIRALRLKSVDPPMPYQRDLAREAEMQQSRISMFETPGMANITLETLSKIAAGLRSGVIVKFVPFSEMLRWENSFLPDKFDVLRLQEDAEFLNPAAAQGDAPARQTSDVGAINVSASVEVPTNVGAESARKQVASEMAASAAVGAGAA